MPGTKFGSVHLLYLPLNNSSRYLFLFSKWQNQGYLLHDLPNSTQFISGISLVPKAVIFSLCLLSLAHRPSLKIFVCSASTSSFQKVYFTSFIVLVCLSWFSSFKNRADGSTLWIINEVSLISGLKLTVQLDYLPWTERQGNFPCIGTFNAWRGSEARRIFSLSLPSKRCSPPLKVIGAKPHLVTVTWLHRDCTWFWKLNSFRLSHYVWP